MVSPISHNEELQLCITPKLNDTELKKMTFPKIHFNFRKIFFFVFFTVIMVDLEGAGKIKKPPTTFIKRNIQIQII